MSDSAGFALLGDLPDHGLVRGQVGTIVELLDDETVEVEFSDDDGLTYAMMALRTEQLRSPSPTLHPARRGTLQA